MQPKSHELSAILKGKQTLSQQPIVAATAQAIMQTKIIGKFYQLKCKWLATL